MTSDRRWLSIPAALIAAVIAPITAVADASTSCAGEYAEDLSALSPRARRIEGATPVYSYAVRTSVTYECVSYGSDGNLRTTRSTAKAYGTAFGYRHDGSDTLLLTNEHVAEWPAVTDDDHPVDGVAGGCKRVSDSLKIVDDDHDDYAGDDIPLTRVVVDPALDVAILRAHSKLEIIPWHLGRSAALVARNVVQVKGFPLGEFQATNIGKVISPYDHDTEGVRNHDDFVIDALLTSGGSGSPVFAVSCKTGEFELVGIFHAHYTGASALNVVVAIDQVRDLMTTLKRSERPNDRAPELDAGSRARLLAAITRDPDPPFFVVGSLVASARVRSDGAMIFAPSMRGVLVVEMHQHSREPDRQTNEQREDGDTGEPAHRPRAHDEQRDQAEDEHQRYQRSSQHVNKPCESRTGSPSRAASHLSAGIARTCIPSANAARIHRPP